VTDSIPGDGSPGAESSGGGNAAHDAASTRSILDTAHEAFVSMDAAGRITGWNQAAQRTFGYSRDEVQGRELAETIVPERYRAKHREGLRHFLATGEHAVLDQRLELWALHRDGYEFPIEITITCGGDRGIGTAEPAFHAFLQDISSASSARRSCARCSR
jgi:two-component system sensor histidine kinase/response regulator